MMLKIDGYNDAIIGECLCWVDGDRVDRLIYDGEKIVEALKLDGMNREEALDYIEFNIEGAYMGPGTPIVMWEYND